MTHRFYNTFSSRFDSFTIIWKEIGSNLRVQRIFLSDPTHNSEVKALELFKNIKVGSSSQIATLSEKITQFLEGEVFFGSKHNGRSL